MRIKNSTNEVKTCTFDVNGTKISGCDNLEITPIALGQRGDFGYGYNFGSGFGFNGSDFLTADTTFGYGYGFDQGKHDEGKFKYKIKWMTKDEVGLKEGDYHATLEAFANINGKFFTYLTDDDATFTLEPKKEPKKPKP